MTVAAAHAEALEIGKLDLSDGVLALAELAKDPVFHKIPAAQYGYYLSRSLDMGRAAAASLHGQSVRGLLEQAGVRFSIAEASGSGALRVALRAQLDWSGRVPQITVYRESMEQLRAAASSSGVFGPLSLDEVVNIHLAHEYYHLLEYRSRRFTNEVLESVECLRLGPFRRKSTVLQTSEIAAHAFCRQLQQLPVLPSLLDHLYLWQTGSLEMKQFTADVKRWTAVLGENGLHML